MHKKSLKEEILDMIDGNLFPKTVNLLEDLGQEEVKFTPEGCYKLCITINGQLYSHRHNEWVLNEDELEGGRLFGGDSAETLSRIAKSLGDVVYNLREKKREIKKSLKDIKGLGDCYQKEFLIEKVV